MNLKFSIVSSKVETSINDKININEDKSFFQDFECNGHTIVKYGALSLPLREVLELGISWAYGSNLPSLQNDEFHQLCEEVVALSRNKC